MAVLLVLLLVLYPLALLDEQRGLLSYQTECSDVGHSLEGTAYTRDGVSCKGRQGQGWIGLSRGDVVRTLPFAVVV